jgi:NAD(P)-dependent dehydrogenase (short-subunit alcohol dehydrogenase family)
LAEQAQRESGGADGTGLLSGRVIVLTGAAAGLGRGYVEPLVRQGALLVLNDIDETGLAEAEAAARELGASVVSVAGSVADWDVANSLVEAAVENFGGLDALVNNAGWHYVSPSHEDTPERIRQMMDTNVIGSMFPGVAALRYFVESGRPGNILNVTSGALSGLPYVAAYAASKGAVASFTYAWAMEYRDRGIRVNALAPTAYTQQVMNTETVRSSVVHWGPEKIAPLTVYLLSDLSAHVTGQVVRMWGDDLHLYAHPHAIAPLLSNTEWTPERIAAAFRSDLDASLQVYARDMTEYVPFTGTAS